MNDRSINLVRELRHRDAALVEELFPAARRDALLETLLSAPRSSQEARQTRTQTGSRVRANGTGRRLRRPLVLSGFGAGAATLAAIAVGASTGVSPAPAQAVSFSTAPGGDILATVTNPFAAQAQLNAAFAQQGLNITVSLLPVSPSIVGTVLYIGESGPSDQITARQGGHCLTGGGGCPIGLEIPKDFAGEGSVALGRPAKPGEAYESAASVFAPGEPLHCSGMLGAKVEAALPLLEARHLTVVQWREELTDPSGGSSHSRTSAQAPLQGYIWGGELVEPAKLRLTTASTPWPDDPGAGSDYNAGC